MQGLTQDRGRDSDGDERESQVGAGQDELNRFERWREQIRSRPTSRRIYRAVVGVIGGAIVIGGLAAVPLPGPGWLIVFLGLGVLATEFEWARRLRDFGLERLKMWTEWLKRQPLWVRGLVALATFAFVCCVVWAGLAYYGVPGFVPDAWVPPLPGLD